MGFNVSNMKDVLYVCFPVTLLETIKNSQFNSEQFNFITGIHYKIN